MSRRQDTGTIRLDEGRRLDAGWQSPLRLKDDRLGRFDVLVPEGETLETAVTVGERFRVPRCFTIDPRRPGRPLIDMVVDPETGPACVALRRKPGSPPLTTRSIRFAVDSYIAGALAGLAVESTGRRAGRSEMIWSAVRARPGGRAEFEEAARRRRLPDDHFERVAAVYREALVLGQPPVEAVAKALHGSRSSAGRWVMETRRRGLLGRAQPRRASA